MSISFRSTSILVLGVGLLLPVASAHAGIPVGACCVGSTCQDNSGAGLDADTCTMTLGGVFQGNSTTCATTICTVPVMSQWGLLVMVLMTLTAGTLVLCRRKAVP